MLYSYAIFMLLKVMLDCSISLQDSMLFNCHTSVVICYVILCYLTASMFKYVSSSKTEPEDKGLLSLSMASLNRTGGEGPVNTTCTAGYVWCFNYNLQPSRSGILCFLNWSIKMKGTGKSN